MNSLETSPEAVLRAFNVTLWPKWWRRAFVILIPVTGPLWLACAGISLALYMALAMIGLVIAVPAFGLYHLWTGGK